MKRNSIPAAINYIRYNITKGSPFYADAVRIRAAVQKSAKKIPGGEEKAWNSIRDNTDDVKPFDPDKDKLGVEPCAPVGKQKRRRKAR